MSVSGPDIWNGPFISIKNSIDMDPAFRPGVEYLKMTRKQQKYKVLKRLDSSLTKCKAYMGAITAYGRKRNNTPHHIIPYTVGEDMIEFIRITTFQY